MIIHRCVFTKVYLSFWIPTCLITLPRSSGTREISTFEQTGGWRLTPDVLNISLHFPRSEVTHLCFLSLACLAQSLHACAACLRIGATCHSLQAVSLGGRSPTHSGQSIDTSFPFQGVYSEFQRKGNRNAIIALQVVGGKEGYENNVRTSYGAWLTATYRDDTIRAIEQRIHDAAGIPHPFGEGIYVLRYEKTQKYNPHTDNCARSVDPLFQLASIHCGGFRGKPLRIHASVF